MTLIAVIDLIALCDSALPPVVRQKASQLADDTDPYLFMEQIIWQITRQPLTWPAAAPVDKLLKNE